MSTPKDLTADDFRETIDENEIVLVDFWADWCGPCKMFAPIYEEAAGEHEDVVFGKVDTEQQQELAAAFQIRSIPTLMAFRDNVLVFNQAGALPKESLVTSCSAATMPGRGRGAQEIYNTGPQRRHRPRFRPSPFHVLSERYATVDSS